MNGNFVERLIDFSEGARRTILLDAGILIPLISSAPAHASTLSLPNPLNPKKWQHLGFFEILKYIISL